MIASVENSVGVCRGWHLARRERWFVIAVYNSEQLGGCCQVSGGTSCFATGRWAQQIQAFKHHARSRGTTRRELYLTNIGTSGSAKVQNQWAVAER